MRTERIIGDRKCYLFGDGRATDVLIQAVGDHEVEGLEREVGRIGELAPHRPFLLAAFCVSDWHQELSPWEAPAVFGREGFGSGAADTLAYITGALMPEIGAAYPTGAERRYDLGGYSLAGLFALWAAYQAACFQGVAAVSPSVWFPQWDRWAEAHAMQAPSVYLSLGDKEERTRNKVMAEVGNRIRWQHEQLCRAPGVGACTLEWNPGNHFADSDDRMARGFAWLLRQR